MVINRDQKYIFIGVPFSASSAISKELVENYNGEFVLGKHSNLPLVRSLLNIDYNEYNCIAVYRNPLQTLYTLFCKMKNNQNEVWTKKSFRRSQGGHIGIKAVLLYRLVQLGLGFQSFVMLKSFFLPIDTFLSLNRNGLDTILNFDNLDHEFTALVQSLGYKRLRPLPSYNVTISKKALPEVKTWFYDYFVVPQLYYLKRQKVKTGIQVLGL